ncbi:hypothetical protein [Streptomyces minutiscleroticus]|uniref:hypothetical protein n=1 Tax=Streptomyces minutiscleroticus TaxID=68238 RepID=UPI001E5827B6|nr:hypothetical protein [Streptomyces minutiscleroticus]
MIPFGQTGFPSSGQPVAYAHGPIPPLGTVALDTDHGCEFLDAEARPDRYRRVPDRMESRAPPDAQSRDLVRRMPETSEEPQCPNSPGRSRPTAPKPHCLEAAATPTPSAYATRRTPTAPDSPSLPRLGELSRVRRRSAGPGARLSRAPRGRWKGARRCGAYGPPRRRPVRISAGRAGRPARRAANRSGPADHRSRAASGRRPWPAHLF